MKEYSYKFNSVDYKKRLSESKYIMEKYPDRIPVIVTKADNCKLNDIDKHKFLVPKDLKISEFISVIRKRVKLQSHEAIFVFINNILPPLSERIIDIYEKEKAQDNFLYVIYNSESVFG